MASSGLSQTLANDFSESLEAALVNGLSVPFWPKNSTKSSTSFIFSAGRASIFLMSVKTFFLFMKTIIPFL